MAVASLIPLNERRESTPATTCATPSARIAQAPPQTNPIASVTIIVITAYLALQADGYRSVHARVTQIYYVVGCRVVRRATTRAGRDGRDPWPTFLLD